MTRAYNPLYLEDAMHNLGTMLDCAVHVAHCDLSVFYEMFLSSGVAAQMETGNPRYVAGLSGMELMLEVLKRSSDITPPETVYNPLERTPEYWAGWTLAYYQWQTSFSFSFIQRNGLTINIVLSQYSTLAMLAKRPVPTVEVTSERRPLMPRANASVRLRIMPPPVSVPPKVEAQKMRNTVLSIPVMPRVCTKLVSTSLPVSMEVPL